MRSKREFFDSIPLFPFSAALSQIMLDTGGGLVAILGILCKELHNDGGYRLGDRAAIRGRHRLARDVAVDPFQWIGGREQERARCHLIQSGTQRVEIAAGICRAIHPPSLFRSHVSKRARDELGWCRPLPIAKKARGKTKAR